MLVILVRSRSSDSWQGRAQGVPRRRRQAAAANRDPGERARAPGRSARKRSIRVGAAEHGNALDRARGVEDMVKRQAAEREARGDGVTISPAAFRAPSRHDRESVIIHG
jgi:hypothetical protein